MDHKDGCCAALGHIEIIYIIYTSYWMRYTGSPASHRPIYVCTSYDLLIIIIPPIIIITNDNAFRAPSSDLHAYLFCLES